MPPWRPKIQAGLCQDFFLDWTGCRPQAAQAAQAAQRSDQWEHLGGCLWPRSSVIRWVWKCLEMSGTPRCLGHQTFKSFNQSWVMGRHVWSCHALTNNPWDPLGSFGLVVSDYCLTREMKLTMLVWCRVDIIPGDSGNSIIQKSQAWLKQTVAAKHGFMMRLHPRITGFGGRSQYRISQCGGFGAPIRTVPWDGTKSLSMAHLHLICWYGTTDPQLFVGWRLQVTLRIDKYNSSLGEIYKQHSLHQSVVKPRCA